MHQLAEAFPHGRYFNINDSIIGAYKTNAIIVLVFLLHYLKALILIEYLTNNF